MSSQAAQRPRLPRVPGLHALRAPGLGATVRVSPRAATVCGLLSGTVVALVLLAMSLGELSVSPAETVKVLVGQGSPTAELVVETLRLPRVLTALLVGLALGAAGALFQSISRNPLGSPDVVGITYGASTGAVLVIVAFGAGTLVTAGGAAAGAVLTAVLISGLALRGRSIQGYRLVLVGVGIGAVMLAGTDFLITRARFEDAQTAQVWINGSLDDRGWEHVVPMAVALGVLLPALVALARPLRLLEMGDDSARALGVAVEPTRIALLVIGVVLTAVAVAAAGPIAFIALAAPQLARRLTRASGPGVMAAALMGAVLLMGSDVVGQHLLGSTQLPVGLVTGVGGGLFLIWLLGREWREGQG